MFDDEEDFEDYGECDCDKCLGIVEDYYEDDFDDTCDCDVCRGLDTDDYGDEMDDEDDVF